MDLETKEILKLIGIQFNSLNDIEEQLIPREYLLSNNKYDEVKFYIPELKKKYSSSFLTCLQQNANKSQKWPLLNLTRQILQIYGYKMHPVRKADGYTLDGVKKYKRYFLINKNAINETKNCYFNSLEIY